MAKWIITIAGVSGLFTVALGAFGAHGLKPVLSESMFSAYQTGVLYQMFHTLALFAVGILSAIKPQLNLKPCALFFISGIVFFSGSLYLMALTGEKWFGPITPLGGVCFMLGWLLLTWRVVRVKSL